MNFTELCAKTYHSFLEGASSPEEMIQLAQEKGLNAIGITDRNGVYGIPKAFNATKDVTGFQLITGANVTVPGLPEYTFLAKTRDGYGRLCQALTEAHKDLPKGEAELPIQKLLKFFEHPDAKGLYLLLNPLQGNEFADHPYGYLKERFPDQIFLKLSQHLDGFDKIKKEKTLFMSRQVNLPIVATNEPLFSHPRKKALQDILNTTKENSTLREMGRRLQKNQERYIKSTHEMQKLFFDLPLALENTELIKENCTFLPSELRYTYPSEWIPKGHTAQSFLEELTWKGADIRYQRKIPADVKHQLQYELDLIEDLKFADYFLTIWDIVDFAKKQEILCQGRGSAANSIICYCLGITAVDPVRMNLLFERFISRERNEPPDIDVDFEHERREEVLQYVYKKYGRHRAAMVCTNITYRTKSAIRDVGKALEVNLSKRDIEKRKEAKEDFAEKEKLFLHLVDEIKDLPRHLSIHSGGFTLSADDLTRIVPVEPATMEGRTVIQWDKYDLDILGLLKVDLLSLGMLTAIRKSFDLLDNRLQLHTVPPEDRETYKMIQQGKTVGVFQIESRAQINMLGRLQPRTFYDLVIEVAIVRPGPIVGQMVHPYLKRRRGQEKVDYPHPKLKPILEKTLGVPLFQEQVMKMAIDLAEFSPGEADHLRRAIGAWRSSGSIEIAGHKLMKGLKKAGLPDEFVKRIFQQIKGFAEYGFPESHAASFALLAYISSYLKCHHPAEFLAALINSQPLGFYTNSSLVQEAKRNSGVRVLPVDIHKSQWDCYIESANTVRLGFRVVKGLFKESYEELEGVRQAKPFTHLHDFLSRTQIRREVLYKLALAGAFQTFKMKPREALWQILEFESLKGLSTGQGQMSLFHQKSFEISSKEKFKELNTFETIKADFDTFKLTTKEHPMKLLRETNLNLPQEPSHLIKQKKSGANIKAAGLIVVRQRPHTAGGVVFATLEDEGGFLDLVLKQNTYKKFKDLFNTESFLIAYGRLQRDRYAASVLVNKVEPLWTGETPLPRLPSHDYH